MHEAQLHQANCFVTLTYEDEDLPPALDHRDYQLFMKRLRKRFTGIPIRYFMCGEYGDEYLRPHFHTCLFNVDFYDKKQYKQNELGQWMYESPTLRALWPQGQHTVQPLNHQTAGYTARYFFKRNTTAESLGLPPEYGRCSTRPGIGYAWFQQYAGTYMLPGDYVVNKDGRKCPVHAYYDKLFKRSGGDLDQVKALRELNALPHRADNLPDRLRVREEVKTAQLRELKRTL